MRRKRILSVSNHAVLLAFRATMLEQRGYEVISILGNARAQCERGGFDLLLIGHSVPDAEADKMIAAWRRRCDAPIVLVLRASDGVREGGHHYVDSLDPEELMKTVTAVLETQSLSTGT